MTPLRGSLQTIFSAKPCEYRKRAFVVVFSRLAAIAGHARVDVTVFVPVEVLQFFMEIFVFLFILLEGIWQSSTTRRAATVCERRDGPRRLAVSLRDTWPQRAGRRRAGRGPSDQIKERISP